MTRVINFIVALTGAWLLYYWARSGGDMEWPWCVAFVSYLIYGAGPHVIKQALDTLRVLKGGKGEAEEAKSKEPPTE